jgi:Fe-S oxidoreductase
VEEALASGAEVIVTACPYCLRMLYKAVEELGVKDQIAVRDLTQLLWQSVMMENEENMMAHIDLAVGEEVCNV